MRNSVLLYINGQAYRISGEAVFMSLANYLRYQCQGTGTKIVCEEGDCGACTVLLGKPENGQLVYRTVNSCIQFLYQLDCTHIISIEGLQVNGLLNPVQEAMVACHGTQCGYCTPGFVVSLCSLFDTKPVSLTSQAIKESLVGNLCRCTGYEPIIRAGLNVDVNQITRLDEVYPPWPMLEAFQAMQGQTIQIETDSRMFFNPVTLEEAVAFKAEHANTVIVSGGTDIGVLCNKKGFEPPCVMSTAHLPDMSTLQICQTAEKQEILTVGARVTLSELESMIKTRIPELWGILNLFGAPQIKNAGTLAGNIANGSPIGDSLPFLMVMDAEVELAGLAGSRKVNLNRLYKGYRSLDLQSDEIITQIHIPLPKPEETLKLYKISKRKHLDISTFTAAIRITSVSGRMTNVRIAYGGVGPVVSRLPETEAFLQDREPTEALFRKAGYIARQEINPISDVRGSRDFRLQLAENILLKFYFETFGAQEAVCLPQ